jgi:hypothetical protein
VGPFGEERSAGGEVLAKMRAGVRDVRLERRGGALETGHDLGRLGHARRAERPRERSRLRRQSRDSLPQDRGAVELGDPNALSRRGGFVRRTDPAKRRSDLGVPGGRLAGGVEEAVIGEDDLRAVGQHQVLADRDPLAAERLDLGEQRLRIHHDARPDDAAPASHDAGGQEVEREMPVAELHGVPGVVPAVVARDDVEASGEKIHDLPLAFVSPLSAEDGRDLHVRCLSQKNEAE